jgi:xanthine dehydrogenase accessory factor
MDDNGRLLAEALGWVRSGKSAALATVVSSWGSSPRTVGSRMAVDDGGHFIGSVSGGCVEGAVLEAAAEVMASGRPQLLEFGVSNEQAWSVGLACGGAIKILVEKLADLDFFERVLDRLEHGQSTAALVALESGERIAPDAPSRDTDASRLIAAAEAGGRDVFIETRQGQFFMEFWRPPLRLFIVGAVHIAQALAPIAATASYEVTIVDPRAAFATPERFGGFSVLTEWPDEFFAKAPLDERCALVALTHEPRVDDPALFAALRSRAFYIGALGSRSTAEKRRMRLRAQRFSERDLARIHGPIGLTIGAANPAEIAIAIAAEMTAALRLSHAAA